MSQLPFDSAIDLDRLRKRTSEKWRHYPDDVLPVFVAESDFPLAEPIAERLRAAIAVGDTGYAQGDGLGEAYASFAQTRYGDAIDEADVHGIPEVIIGVAEILRIAGKPGDALIITSPVYPPFFSIVAEVGWVVADAPLRREGARFELDFEAIEARMQDGARVMLLCSPHNPVGRVYTRDELLRVAELAQRYGVMVLSDEIHAPLVLPGARFTPFSSVARETGVAAITLTSASKGWNIAGLKCAIAVAHDDASRRILRKFPKEMIERCGHLGVHATVAAFRDGVPYLDKVVEHLDGMRAHLREIFDTAGLRAITFESPEAGYLAWLDCTALDLDHPASVFYKYGSVALVPGEYFGKAYARWARFNYATSTKIVTEAARRMSNALTLTAR